MTVEERLRGSRWTRPIGYVLFIGMMAAGYYYNITFVQIGLTDLGERILGMEESRVALFMAGLALVTTATALLFGYWVMRTNRSADFYFKLKAAFFVVLTQTLLTAVSGLIQSELSFGLWLFLTSLALGVGMPATFSLTVDLIPRRRRGYAAAWITAIAYFAAETFSTSWTFPAFRWQMLALTAPGAVGMGVLLAIRPAFLDELSRQHLLPEFARGRFVTRTADGELRMRRSFLGLLALMFGIYFVDSLGFLRLLDTPVYMATAWQSGEINIRLIIAAAHVVAALAAGVLYTYTSERSLFLWIFGIFALAHLEYIFHVRIGPAGAASLAMPLLYAVAVSLYTVMNFALWADLSTPETISMNSAVGVALSGWTATFLSTALAIRWAATGMTLERHLQIVNSLAFLFFLATAAVIYFQGGRSPRSSRDGRQE